MPEFLLPLDSAESHQWFDGLPEIARGYVEAAFFTGVQYWSGDGEPVEIDSAGPALLDADGRAALEADALRFWLANAETLEIAAGSGGYDLEQAGRDFWFTRNRHGVGFWDRPELAADIRDRLQNAAEAEGEFSLFAEPSADARREAFALAAEGDPEALAEIAAEREADETGTGWRVTGETRAEPLREIERAAVAALEAGGASAVREAARTHAGDVGGALAALERIAGTRPPLDPLRRVGGRYGAPMGRRSDALDPETGEAYAARVTLDPGGYDSGGAYWGTGAPLWRVTDGAGGTRYVRAQSAAEAVREALA